MGMVDEQGDKGAPRHIKFVSETTEVDKDGNTTTYLEVDDETAEMFLREDLELAEQWAAELKMNYEAKKIEADAKVNECRRELHEFLAEKANG